MEQQTTLYNFVEDSEADGFAWVFNNPKSEAVKRGFKFPPISPSEVRIKTLFFGVGQNDVHMVHELHQHCFPLVPGTAVVGEVVLKGSEVQNVQVGDVVGFGQIRRTCGVCEFCVKQQEQFCKTIETSNRSEFGSFATHFQGSSRWAIPIPNSIKPEQAVPLLNSGLSVFAPIQRYGVSGAHVAVYGFGELGVLATQFAVKSGYKVTVFGHQADRKDQAHALGASEFVHINEKEDSSRALTYELVLLTENIRESNHLERVIDLAKQEGFVVRVGRNYTGKNVEISFACLVFFNRKLTGSLSGNRQQHFEVVQFAVRNNIVPDVEVHTVEQLNCTFKHVGQSKNNKSVVIKV